MCKYGYIWIILIGTDIDIIDKAGKEHRNCEESLKGRKHMRLK